MCSINGSLSQSCLLSCGVPHKMILGPLLFLLYIHDLPNCLSKCEPRIYADDTHLTYAGGVGILIKNGLHVKESTGRTRDFTSFEFIDLLIASASSWETRLLVIYRPPSCNCPMFLDDFVHLMEQYITDSTHLLVAGNLNYSIDDAGDKASSHFSNLLGSLNLKQHVDKSTQCWSHFRPFNHER